MSSTKKGLFQAVVAILLFGTLPASIKFVSANTITIGVFRLLLAASVLALLLQMKGEFKQGVFKHWKVLLPIGFVFGLHWYTYFEAIKISSASIGAVGVSSYGVHLIWLGLVFEKGKKSFVDIGCVVLAIVGTYLVVPEFSFGNNTTLGFCYGLLSGFLYALLPILHKRAILLSDQVRTFGQFFFALLVFLPFVTETSWNYGLTDYLVLFHLGFVCTVIGHSLWVSATTSLPIATSALVYYLYVPTALLFSFFILGESLETKALIGVGLILTANIGGVLFGSTFKKKAASL